MRSNGPKSPFLPALCLSLYYHYDHYNLAQRSTLERQPDVVVATPARIAACLKEGVLHPGDLQEQLQMIVLDEVQMTGNDWAA